MKHIYSILILVLFVVSLNAQNTAITDSATYSAKSSAMLDVQSVHKGFLAPRMTTGQREGILSAVEGLMVYDITLQEFYVYKSGAWNPIADPAIWLEKNDSVYVTGDGVRVGVGTSSPLARLSVVGDATAAADEPLFEVKNSDGVIIFAVYEDEVKVNFMESSKGAKGGFAVGGLTPGKSDPTEYLRVTPDSVRIYINDTGTKGAKGGFAVGGLSPGKLAGDSYLTVEPDSTRIYVNDNGKGSKGGFAVGGLTPGKAGGVNFLDLTPENYFIGHQSGENIDLGIRNSVMGYQSGQGLIGGSYNVFLGYMAGNLTDEGDKNVFIGYQSGRDNTSGSDNTFIGDMAGQSNDDGSFNVFVGYSAGVDNEDGEYNTFLGFDAGSSNIGGVGTYDGDYNTFIGYRSGPANTSGYRNTFLGYYSGENNTEGSSNIFIGGYAGKMNTTSDNNLYVGYTCGRNATGSGNAFFGYGAGLGNTSNCTGTLNTFVGYNAGHEFSSGSSNVALGYYAGYSNTTGSYNVFLGRNAGRQVTGDSYKLYIYSGTATSPTPLIYGDFSSTYVVINGTDNNSKDFYVNGSAGGSGSWNAKSDGALKSNTRAISSALNKVEKLQGIKYDYMDTETKTTSQQIGLDPEKLLEAIPEVIQKHDDGTYSIQYAPITSVLIEAIKEQQKQIEELEKKVEELSNK